MKFSFARFENRVLKLRKSTRRTIDPRLPVLRREFETVLVAPWFRRVRTFLFLLSLREALIPQEFARGVISIVYNRFDRV